MNLTQLRSSLCVLLLCAAAQAQAAIIHNYSAPVNDRFANDPSFIAADYDLSGVAMDNAGRWLTMLSPNVFLSAAHLAPAVGSSVTFYAGNDSTGPSMSSTVSFVGQAVAGSDLWIGLISEPLPANYNYYAYATQSIDSSNWADSPYYMADALVVARSPGSAPVSLDFGVGQNQLDNYFGATVVGGVTGDAMGSIVDAPGAANFLPYELELRPGDSGGPVFVDVDGELTLVAINWFVGTEDELTLNGYTYIGNYAAEIDGFLAIHSVPEPSHYALGAGLAVVTLAILRRRLFKAGAAAV